jgi:glutamine synthetase
VAVDVEQATEERLQDVRAAGATRLRIHFTDLLGVSRNKVVPLEHVEEACEDGLNFCISAFCVDHAGQVVEGTGLGA